MAGDLDSYLGRWSLADPELIAETFTSAIYKVRRIEGPAVLKLLNEAGGADEEAGALALECFDGRGAVRLFEHDRRAQLLEYAEGEDLTALVRRGEDRRASEIIAGVLNELHGTRPAPPPGGLIPLRERFASLFERARSRTDGPIFARAAAVAERLLRTERERCVLHGDMHHENVRHCAGRGWLAIDPKGLCGERAFDAANVPLNPRIPGLVVDERRYLATVGTLAAAMGLDRRRLLDFAFAFAALSACWAIEDGQDPTLALATAEIAAPHAGAAADEG